MNRHGFTLIELMVAMFMASVVSIALFTAFSQSLSIQKTVDDFLYLSGHEYMIHKQLSDDLMGAFIPLQGAPQQPQVTKNPAPKSGAAQQQNAQTNPAAQEPEKKIKPLEKVFFATDKSGLFDNLTFITRNPLAIYWSDYSGHAKAKRARVIYQLEAEADHENSYRLTRQEGSELVAKKYEAKETNGRKYTVATGIKSMQLTYTYSVAEEKPLQKNQPPGQKLDPQKTTPAKISFKTLKSWNSDDEKQRKETKALLPDFVQITTELWDKQRKKSSTITSTVALISDKEVGQKKQQLVADTNAASSQQPTPASAQASGAFTPAPPRASNDTVTHIGTIDLSKLDELPKTAQGYIDWTALIGKYI